MMFFFEFNCENIIDLTLKAQNRFGGFAVKFSSSACEEIDSIDLLVRLRPYVDNCQHRGIDSDLSKAWGWVYINQVEDDGLVFRLSESMQYGHI